MHQINSNNKTNINVKKHAQQEGEMGKVTGTKTDLHIRFDFYFLFNKLSCRAEFCLDQCFFSW